MLFSSFTRAPQTVYMVHHVRLLQREAEAENTPRLLAMSIMPMRSK